MLVIFNHDENLYWKSGELQVEVQMDMFCNSTWIFPAFQSYLHRGCNPFHCHYHYTRCRCHPDGLHHDHHQHKDHHDHHHHNGLHHDHHHHLILLPGTSAHLIFGKTSQESKSQPNIHLRTIQKLWKKSFKTKIFDTLVWLLSTFQVWGRSEWKWLTIRKMNNNVNNVLYRLRMATSATESVRAFAVWPRTTLPSTAFKSGKVSRSSIFCLFLYLFCKGKLNQCDHSLQTLLTLPGAVDLHKEESTVQQWVKRTNWTKWVNKMLLV